MDSNTISLLAVTGAIAILLVAIGIIMLTGRGAFLIAGYNTMPKSEREKYDKKALCKFIGKILIVIGAATPLCALGDICNIAWLPAVYAALIIGLTVFAIIYANTGNRFKK